MKEKVLEILKKGPMTIEELMAEVGGNRREIRMVIAELLRSGALKKVADRERRKVLIGLKEQR